MKTSETPFAPPDQAVTVSDQPVVARTGAIFCLVAGPALNWLGWRGPLRSLGDP